QTVRAFPRLTLLENVVVGAFGQHARNETAILAARGALEKVGLTGAAQLMASSLTNHELRLMELARALASNPKLILMDESFAGLASEDIDQMMPVILSLRRSGTTIVIIEHTMQAMVRLVDRLIVMDQGSIIAEGPPEDVVKNPAVISAYLGKKWVDNAQT
ncbi:MAG: ABC transporter ATP-binding protein, partial [Candidatus Promineofilum sp.]|nr:ABC transporter ATP-binding protein [Promineifilum sp.]